MPLGSAKPRLDSAKVQQPPPPDSAKAKRPGSVKAQLPLPLGSAMPLLGSATAMSVPLSLLLASSCMGRRSSLDSSILLPLRPGR